MKTGLWDRPRSRTNKAMYGHLTPDKDNKSTSRKMSASSTTELTKSAIHLPTNKIRKLSFTLYENHSTSEAETGGSLEFKAGLVYILSSRIARAMERPCLNKPKPNKKLTMGSSALTIHLFDCLSGKTCVDNAALRAC